MNKTYFRIRCIIAWVTGILCFLAFFSAFYPVKIFDLQLTALLQRFLVDVSLTAAILLSALLLLTLFFGRVYCSTLCPFGLFQEFLMLFFRRRTGYRQNRPAKYFLAAVFFGMLLGGTVAVIRLIDPLRSFRFGGKRRASRTGCFRIRCRSDLVFWTYFLRQHLSGRNPPRPACRPCP